MKTLTQRRRLLSKDGLEDPHQRIRQLVLQIILRIDRDIVLQHVDRVFRLLVRCGTFHAFDDDVGDTVAQVGCGTGVALLHTLGKFDVGLFCGIVLMTRRVKAGMGNGQEAAHLLWLGPW